jgi:hypothetical protein
MFDGERQCCICKSETEKKVHRLTLSGHSRTFCQKCFNEMKEEVKTILQDNKK